MNIAESNEPLAQRILFLIKESGLKQFVVAERAGYSAQELDVYKRQLLLIRFRKHILTEQRESSSIPVHIHIIPMRFVMHLPALQYQR